MPPSPANRLVISTLATASGTKNSASANNQSSSDEGPATAATAIHGKPTFIASVKNAVAAEPKAFGAAKNSPISQSPATLAPPARTAIVSQRGEAQQQRRREQRKSSPSPAPSSNPSHR